MKKGLIFSVVILLALVSISMASAKTIIAGKIYDSPNLETANGVGGATVTITCNNHVQVTTSKDDGTYGVEYLETGDESCDFGDSLKVHAIKEGVGEGEETGIIQDYKQFFDINLGIVNVPLVPEFGIIIGGLTLVSAIAVFFVIRRK